MRAQLEREALEEGEPPPIFADPDVDPAFLWIWQAWHRLHGSRVWLPGGMGPPAPGGIPWHIVKQWCDHHGYDADEMGFLDEVLQEMDQVFFKHHIAQLKRKPK